MFSAYSLVAAMDHFYYMISRTLHLLQDTDVNDYGNVLNSIEMDIDTV